MVQVNQDKLKKILMKINHEHFQFVQINCSCVSHLSTILDLQSPALSNWYKVYYKKSQCLNVWFIHLCNDLVSVFTYSKQKCPWADYTNYEFPENLPNNKKVRNMFFFIPMTALPVHCPSITSIQGPSVLSSEKKTIIFWKHFSLFYRKSNI